MVEETCGGMEMKGRMMVAVEICRGMMEEMIVVVVIYSRRGDGDL